MPPEGIECAPREDLLNFEEILRLAGILVELGVRKVRLTGGEPTLRRDLPRLVKRLKAIPRLDRVYLTSNGVALSPILPELTAAGLNGVTLSLDSLSPDKFQMITGRDHFREVMESLEAALSFGELETVKVNMVVLRSLNLGEVPRFVRLAREKDLEVRFVEFMPFGRNRWRGDEYVPESEIRAAVGEELMDHPRVDPMSGPARLYALRGGRGRIGFISSLSHPFCGSCNRLRLSSLGRLTACLHREGTTDLRRALREGATDEEITSLIRQEVARKPHHGSPDGKDLISGLGSPAAIGG